MVGAHLLARQLGLWITQCGHEVRLLDTDPKEVSKAKEAGLIAYHGSALDEHDIEQLDTYNVDHFLALTSNAEVNLRACQLGRRLLGNVELWRLAEAVPNPNAPPKATKWGRQLFPGLPDIELVNQALEAGTMQLTIRRQENSGNAPIPSSDGISDIPLCYSDQQKISPIDQNTLIPEGAEVIWLTRQ